MAEKQYKNYDERFLKEEASEPIVIEAVFSSDERMLLISEWPDGTPIKTVEDLYSVFKSRVFITFTTESDSQTIEIMASPVTFRNVIIDGQSGAVIVVVTPVKHMNSQTLVTTEELYNTLDPAIG